MPDPRRRTLASHPVLEGGKGGSSIHRDTGTLCPARRERCPHAASQWLESEAGVFEINAQTRNARRRGMPPAPPKSN
eukprot:11178328-Lingulodinium_polyedra.AAC.1